MPQNPTVPAIPSEDSHENFSRPHRKLKVSMLRAGLHERDITIPEYITAEDLILILGEEYQDIAKVVAQFPHLAQRLYIPQVYARQLTGRTDQGIYLQITNPDTSHTVDLKIFPITIHDPENQENQDLTPYFAEELITIRNAIKTLRGTYPPDIDTSNPTILTALISKSTAETIIDLHETDRLPDDAPSEIQAARILVNRLQLTEEEVELLRNIIQYHKTEETVFKQKQQIDRLIQALKGQQRELEQALHDMLYNDLLPQWKKLMHKN